MLLPEVSSSSGADCPVLQKLTRAMYRHVLCAMLHHQPPPGQTRVGILYEGRIMKQEYGTKRPNFPFFCVCVVHVYLYAHICMWECRHMGTECMWRPNIDVRRSSPSVLPFLDEAESVKHRGCRYHMASLASQLARGICLHLLRLELQVGCQTPSFHLGSGDLNFGPHPCAASGFVVAICWFVFLHMVLLCGPARFGSQLCSPGCS